MALSERGRLRAHVAMIEKVEAETDRERAIPEG
jgi:hypothetical protein